MKITTLAFATLIFASPVFASPCAFGTLQSYITAGSCTINGESVFFDPSSFLAVTGPLTASDINVTPSSTATSYTLYFSSSGFSVSTGTAQYDINFYWDPLVGGAEDDMVANSPVYPGTASVTTNICAGSPFGGATCPTNVPTNALFIFDDGRPADDILQADTIFTSQVLQVGTQSTLTLTANSGSSEISGFSTSVFITPEPGGMMLGATGVLALAWRRFRGRRQPAV